MKRLVRFLALSLPFLLISCGKEETSENTPPPDFVQLDTGNYWVYNYYKLDTNGVATLLPGTDSSYIQKDTVINGNQYFIKISDNWPMKGSLAMQPYPQKSFLRDSSGYLVTETGFIMFARDNFTDAIRRDTIEGLTWWEYKMTGKDSVVAVPAGTFTTRTMGVTYYPLNQNYPWGVRRGYNIYGAGVGMIKYSYGLYSQPGYYEGRLIRYHVNPGTTKH